MMNYNGPFNERYGLSHQGWEIEFFSWWIIASIDLQFLQRNKTKNIEHAWKIIIIIIKWNNSIDLKTT